MTEVSGLLSFHWSTDFVERMASPMNPDNFFLGNKRRSLMISEMGKLSSLGSEETGENGLLGGGGEEHASAGACGGVVEGDGRLRSSLGCPSVDRALVQHLIHCECLLQVSMKRTKSE